MGRSSSPIFVDFLLQHKERALMILATMIMTMMCGDPNDAKNNGVV
jgi:hypothetical protein